MRNVTNHINQCQEDIFLRWCQESCWLEIIIKLNQLKEAQKRFGIFQHDFSLLCLPTYTACTGLIFTARLIPSAHILIVFMYEESQAYNVNKPLCRIKGTTLWIYSISCLSNNRSKYSFFCQGVGFANAILLAGGAFRNDLWYNTMQQLLNSNLQHPRIAINYVIMTA